MCHVHTSSYALKGVDYNIDPAIFAETTSIMTLKFLCTLGILLMTVLVSAQQRWLTANDKSLQTDGMFTEYPLPNPGSGPTTIALAPDGTLWFTESAGNRIGRMNPDGTGLKEFPLPNPGSAPRIIALGSDGNMWFSEHTGNRMGRIAPDGHPHRVPDSDAEQHAARDRARRPTATSGLASSAAARSGGLRLRATITEFPIPTPDSGPRALAAGPDGNIWFSEFNASKIGRITPQGVITEFPLPRPNSGPGDITAGADGHMWFVELAGTMDGRKPDGNRVGRITMSGEVTEFPIPSQTGSPINIAVGPDRNIWFTKGGIVGRVTPDGVDHGVSRCRRRTAARPA